MSENGKEKGVSERIMTLHPAGKKGVSIDRAKYDVVRQEIEQALRDQPGLAFGELTETVNRRIGATFDGSVSWYVVSVKLDLEARGLVERVDTRGPQRLRLAQSDGKV